MANCAPKLTEDILFDCADKSKKGIAGGKAVLINFDDIDRSGSTVSGSVISDLVLSSGTTGFALEWYKELASSNSSYSPSTDDYDGFLQNFLCRMGVPSADVAERSRELKEGRFIVVYELRYKGALSAEAFNVLGWENGLKLSELTWSTLENSASVLFTLGTEDGDFEEYPFMKFLETDYATSKATFDSLFAIV